MREYFTTGQVAKLFPVSMKITAKKVAQLFDDGELKGVRYSDGGRRRTVERRITPESLALFIARNKKVNFRVDDDLRALVAKAKKNAIGNKDHKSQSTQSHHKQPRVCRYFTDLEAARGPLWAQRARLIAG